MTTTLNASNSGSGGLVATADASGILALQTAGTTAVTIDTSQNVGIGTTSPVRRLTVAYPGSAEFVLQDTTQAANSRNWRIYNGANSLVMGTLNDAGTAGTDMVKVNSSGQFFVSANGSSNPGMSVDPSGYMGLGNSAGSSGFGFITFYRSGTNIGSITQNGTTGVLYNLTSDYRLKDNPVPLTGAKDFVMALQPKTWDWWDGSGKGVGFIAHEFMDVAKYSGHGKKDAVDADNKPVYQSIQPSSSEVMANLVAFIQEQQALITSLTARIAALEGQTP